MQRFKDPRPEEFSREGINPHLLRYWTHGPPVLIGAHAAEYKADWGAVFGRDAPLHLEIGCGNGFYLSGMAGIRREENWLGIEIRYKRVMMCAKKIEVAGVGTRFVRSIRFWKPPSCSINRSWTSFSSLPQMFGASTKTPLGLV